MIWFTCKQCGKAHGRSETSAGSLVFCECGHGNLVPWESTALPPGEGAESTPAAEPAPAVPALPVLEPLSFEQDKPAASKTKRSKRRGRYVPDPNFCLNHESVPSRKTCSDCGESFCDDCVLTFQGAVLCGPCKNQRVRTLQQPARVSGLALASLLLALVSGPLAMGLIGALGDIVFTWVAMISQVVALFMGVIAFRLTEKSPKLSGRSLALTGVLMSATSAGLTLVLTVFGARIWT